MPNLDVRSQSFPYPYCNTSFSYDIEPITFVEFAGVANTSSNIISSDSTALEDFTSVRIYVGAESDYLIKLKGNTGGNYTDYFTAYIDWDDDGMFNSYERYNVGTISNSDGTDSEVISSYIFVPMVLPGAKRMRIIKHYDSYAVDPCGAYSYGQAEDYTVVVLGCGSY